MIDVRLIEFLNTLNISSRVTLPCSRYVLTPKQFTIGGIYGFGSFVGFPFLESLDGHRLSILESLDCH